MRTFALLVIPVLSIVFPLCVIVGGAQKTEVPKYSTTVKLDISAQDEIKNEVYSYTSRELRSLGDVKLVEDNPQWIIRIVALQVENRGGYSTGVVFSVVIESRIQIVEVLLYAVKSAFQMNSEEWEKLKETKQHKDLVKAFTKVTDGLGNIRGHSLRVGDTEDTQRICQGIVADFDTEHLKQSREMWQKMFEEFLYKPIDGAAKESENKPEKD